MKISRTLTLKWVTGALFYLHGLLASSPSSASFRSKSPWDRTTERRVQRGWTEEADTLHWLTQQTKQDSFFPSVLYFSIRPAGVTVSHAYKNPGPNAKLSPQCPNPLCCPGCRAETIYKKRKQKQRQKQRQKQQTVCVCVCVCVCACVCVRMRFNMQLLSI